MREICFDTETTGLDPNTGDRIIELGCVELVNLLPTGKEFHAYVNPNCQISEATTRITGISGADLQDSPEFSAIMDDLLEFIGSSCLVAHNASFDSGFLNAELSRYGQPPLPPERFVDTLEIARSRFIGQSNSLDALCRRFDICLQHRQLHGALKDARLLAAVYLELRGGREQKLDLNLAAGALPTEHKYTVPPKARPAPLPERIDKNLIAAHKAFIASSVGDKAFWRAWLD